VGWSLGCDSRMSGERAHARTASAGSATVAVDATTAAAPRESAQVRKEVGEDTWWCDARGSVCQPAPRVLRPARQRGRSRSRTASVSTPQSRPPCAARGGARRRLQDAALGAAGATVASETACRRNVQRAAAAMLLTTRAGLPTLVQSWHPSGSAFCVRSHSFAVTSCRSCDSRTRTREA